MNQILNKYLFDVQMEEIIGIVVNILYYSSHISIALYTQVYAFFVRPIIILRHEQYNINTFN